MTASISIDRETSIRQAQIFSYGSGDGLRDVRKRGFVPAVEDPAAPLVRIDESGPAQQVHVVRDRGLGEADRALDVAGAEAPFLASDQVAAGLSAGPQEVQNLQARRDRRGP